MRSWLAYADRRTHHMHCLMTKAEQQEVGTLWKVFGVARWKGEEEDEPETPLLHPKVETNTCYVMRMTFASQPLLRMLVLLG